MGRPTLPNKREGSCYEIKVTMHNRDVLLSMKSMCLLVNGKHHPDGYFGLEDYPVETGIGEAVVPNENVFFFGFGTGHLDSQGHSMTSISGNDRHSLSPCRMDLIVTLTSSLRSMVNCLISYIILSMESTPPYLDFYQQFQIQ